MEIRVCPQCRVENPSKDSECSECGALLWEPEQASPADPPMLRECRFCGESVQWNITRCSSCGRARWNDPDDTALGRALGQAERENPQAAAGAKIFDALLKGKPLAKGQ